MNGLRLHKVTWLIILAGAAGLCANLLQMSALFRAFYSADMAMLPAEARNQIGEMWARVILDTIFSIGFFASAAMVEFLWRILQELRNLRAGAGAPS